MLHISCSVCAETLLSFCVYEQRLYCVFAMYVLAMHVNQSDNAKNRLIYCIMQACKCIKAELCLRSMYVYVMYMSCSMCAKTLLLFCVYKQRLCHVFAMYVFTMYVNWSENQNWLIYCVAQMCMCTKAELCLRSICVYIVYEFNMWIKCCYCSVCDYAACKLIWKCEKLIDLLHHICLYICKSWIMSS